MSLKNLIDDVTKEIGMEIRNNEVLYHCPVCHHRKRKLSINIQTHDWKCWVCGKTHGTEGSSLKTLFKIFKAHQKYIDKLDEYGYKKQIVSPNRNLERIISLPLEFIPLYKPSKDINYKHAISYLKKRGMCLTDIVKYNIGYCNTGKFSNHIIFPSYDKNGVLNYYIGRTWYDHYTNKYKKPEFSSHKIIGLEFFINWKFPVFICEGIFDAAAIKRNAIPLYGKILGPYLKEQLVLHKPPTYLIFDNDALTDLTKTCEELLRYDVPIFPVILNEKDPSEMGYKKIHELINNTTELTFSDLIRMKLYA
jgi:ribosomal protein L37AE/L43A